MGRKEKKLNKLNNKYDLRVGSIIYRYRLNEDTGRINEYRSVVSNMELGYVLHQNEKFGRVRLDYGDIDRIDAWLTMYTPTQREEVEIKMVFSTYLNSEINEIIEDAEAGVDTLSRVRSLINKAGDIVRK